MQPIKAILFFIIVFLSNIIQGITGFAGTILAMPFSIMLIDVTYSKFILNILGILASAWIVSRYRSQIDKKECKKIIFWMGLGLIGGIILYQYINASILLKILPVFIIFIAIKGLYQTFNRKRKQNEKMASPKELSPQASILILLGAGLMHGLFVVGGPILIIYATRKCKDKLVFRSTLSLVWLILNSVIFVSQVPTIQWNQELVLLLMVAVLGLFLGIIVGDKLVKKMSQQLFMTITFILLFISGISILFK